MRISLSIETLQDAYDICLLVKENSANVIAGAEEYENIKSDKEWYEKSKRFMDAFDKACERKPDRKQYRSDWIKRLESSLSGLNDALDKLNKETEN